MRVPLSEMPIPSRDEYVAEVIAFLRERGYTITAPGLNLAAKILELHHIRLSEIDAPEIGIAFGNTACQECAAPWPCTTVLLVMAWEKSSS